MDPKENLVGSRADPLAGNVRSEGPTDATLGQFFDKFCFVNKTKLIENHCRQQDDNCLTTGPHLISFFQPKAVSGQPPRGFFFGLTDEMGAYNFENK